MSAHEPIHSPVASLGTYLRRCSSLPAMKNMIGAERIVRRHNEADGGIDAREFFDDNRVVDVAEPRAAQLLGKDCAQKPELPGFLDGSSGKIASSSHSRTCGRISCSANWRTLLAKVNLLRCEVKFHGKRRKNPNSMVASAGDGIGSGHQTEPHEVKSG